MDQLVNNDPFVYPWTTDPNYSAAQLELWNAEIQWIALCGQLDGSRVITSDDDAPLRHGVEIQPS